MLEYVLGPRDMTEIRFGISPLTQLTLSLRVLRDPGRFPLHLPWVSEVRPLWGDLDLPMLSALVDPERGWVPDMLTPRPSGPLVSLDDELETVAAQPISRLRGELHSLNSDLPEPARGRGDAVRRRLVRALRAWWDACLQPYWPRLRSLLEADITYRGRQQAQLGTAGMINALSERVSMNDNVIRIHSGGDPRMRRVHVEDLGGLTLAPTVFNRFASVPYRDDEPPTIAYNARGQGTLWLPETRDPATHSELAAVIGPVRAHLLVALAEPASSTDLARRLRVTTSAVNQQLRALYRVGLVGREQYGRSVLYRRSHLADRLVAGSIAQEAAS
ncbi:ArsR/SmtB family transcription factor [Luteipulveratus halotolerans]|uniref:HTH arsR-type domain-containing protein n=1 Tax=Luteipulveratus halotolerans TaxID=1631356 RepID=A0A0L6CPA4_9MICO|nr:ArsR family transcriptional regulator [Luteipulveratus halotolerans]KNX39601.1 hypothetical protein VV01_18950 [Luteipulveratus halotolerans]